MNFSVNSSLHYYVYGPSTLICSLSCIRTQGQHVVEESLVTSRDCDITELGVGLAENRFTRIEVSAPGELSVEYHATVNNASQEVSLADISEGGVASLDAAVIPYLFPSRYAPSDRVRVLAGDLFGGINGQFNQAVAVEDWLARNIAYQIGSSGEQSWALDTLDFNTGVCRDFAHLGIAFCRALTIPARYSTVYAYGLDPQDFHAVFEVYVGGTWFVMDGTKKAPLNGMVRIATGRDAGDAAVATLFGNIEGQGVEVGISPVDGDEADFRQVTRENLQSRGQTLFLF